MKMAECKFVDGNEEFLGKISEIFAEILFHVIYHVQRYAFPRVESSLV